MSDQPKTTLGDLGASLIRTYVPIAVAALVALLVGWGINLPEGTAEALATGIGAVAGGVYYWAIRELERRWPWVGKLLGVARQPGYALPEAKSDVDGTVE